MYIGRCARAGRKGIAYSLVTPDEYAYLIDLHLFLGRTLNLITLKNSEGNIGRLPQVLIEDQLSTLTTLHETHMDLVILYYYNVFLCFHYMSFTDEYKKGI